MFKNKKAKAAQEPQYYMSKTNIPTLNYKVYYYKPLEKLAYFLLAFAVGAAVGFLFYGGIGKDEYGNATVLTIVLNILIPLCAGTAAGIMFLPVRMEQIIAKRKRMLNQQFRDMLETLTTALGAGKNVVGAFETAYEDLKNQYEEGSYILKELEVINAGIQNNIKVEEILMDFADRSGNNDIHSFASVFEISYRKGGNIKDIIRETHVILSDKMQISEEIETIVTSNKTEQKIMVFMPIILIAMIKLMSPEFANNFVTPTGLISTTLAIGMFVVAYFVGKMVLDIKI